MAKRSIISAEDVVRDIAECLDDMDGDDLAVLWMEYFGNIKNATYLEETDEIEYDEVD